MRYRTKIALLLALLTMFTGALVVGLYSFQCRTLLLEQIRSQVLSIAATGALQINPELLNEVRSVENEGDASYAAVRDSLRRIRDANRREDANVRFVSVLRPLAPGSDKWVYVVDAGEDENGRAHVGDPVEFDFELGAEFENSERQELTLERPSAARAFRRDAFGVWLSANSPILDSRGEPVGLLSVSIAAEDVLVRLRNLYWRGFLATAVGIAVSMVFAVAIAGWANGQLKRIRIALQHISGGDWSARVEFTSSDEFGAVAETVNKMAAALRDREMLKVALARYTSQNVADRVLADQELPSLRGERRQITVLIADVRNFTAMSERLPPEDLVRGLNSYFEKMLEAIYAHRGTLDKFLGDGLLAVFGAPLDDAEHQKMAIFAAEAMLKAARRLRAEIRVRHKVDWRIGIGVHTGWAVVGNVGSEMRMEYTAIGDTVNAASRIEGLNKEYHTEFLASEAVVDAVGDCFKFREVDAVQLRGTSNSMKLYTFDTSSD
jgi:adenylate cyclase